MAVRLLEMGEITPVYLPPPPLFRSLIHFVQTFEDPLAASGGFRADSRTKEIANKLRRASIENRLSLVPGLLRKAQMGDIFEFFASAYETVAPIVTKVADVVSDPAFLQAAAGAANFIGGSTGEKLSGILSSFAKQPSTQQAAVQAAATSQSIAQVAPQYAGNASDLSALFPPALQQQVAALVGQTVPALQGRENDVIAAALKALGQFTAVQTFAQGTGAGALGGSAFSGLANLIMGGASGNTLDALRAGQQDLLNAAALSGDTEAVLEALRRGSPDTFPWIPVLAAGGGGIFLITLLAIVSSRGR